jgi:hypothetical protein
MAALVPEIVDGSLYVDHMNMINLPQGWSLIMKDLG